MGIFEAVLRAAVVTVMFGAGAWILVQIQPNVLMSLTIGVLGVVLPVAVLITSWRFYVRVWRKSRTRTLLIAYGMVGLVACAVLALYEGLRHL
jgi:hypothetical protein